MHSDLDIQVFIHAYLIIQIVNFLVAVACSVSQAFVRVWFHLASTLLWMVARHVCVYLTTVQSNYNLMFTLVYRYFNQTAV